MGLNTEQRAAAEIGSGHSLILAGPGTGKTTTLVARYKHLLSVKTSPASILCCTFSKKASDELKDRIGRATGLNTKPLPIGTFHALSVRILRRIGIHVRLEKDFEIWAKDWERLKIVGSILQDAIDNGAFENVDREDKAPQRALEYIDTWRENLLDPEDASIRSAEQGDDAGVAISEVYRLYDEYLNDQKKIDFPRMVQLACKALEKDAEQSGQFARQFSHILVDEFQDINHAQKVLIDHLVNSGGQLWSVGDDFQAIYGWRGSDVRYLLNFRKFYRNANVLSLVQNYRSVERIIRVANNLSDHFKEKYDKQLVCTREDKGDVYFRFLGDVDKEALAIRQKVQAKINDGVPPNEIAVLARTNKLPTTVVYSLIKAGIPVELKGGVEAFSDYEARLLLTALAVSSNRKLEAFWTLKLGSQLYGFAKKLSEESWERRVKALTTFISNRPPKAGTEDELATRARNLEELRDYVLEFEDDEFLFSVLKALDETKNDTARVFVGTIHSAKGLEWDTVAVMGWEDGVMPQRQSESPRVYEEERRIAYVAITRAKNSLLLTAVKERDDREPAVSPFIDELFDDDVLASSINVELEPTSESSKSGGGPRPSSGRELSTEERLEWIRHLREKRKEVEREAKQKIADGNGGDGTGWADQSAGTGLLAEAGYTVRKDGPNSVDRQNILADVLHGRVHIPDWISDTVQEQWGKPSSQERLTKIRNTINVALGNQKGRSTPSIQAIEKWEADLAFIDTSLRPQLEKEIEEFGS